MSLYEKRDFDTNHIEVIDSKTKKVVDRYPMPDVEYLRAETEEESMMKSFEERKKEYRSKILIHMDLAENLMKHMVNDDGEAFVDPKNEAQLQRSAAIFYIYSLYSELSIDNACYEDFSTNIVVKTAIANLFNSDSIAPKISIKEFNGDLKVAARYLYDLSLLSSVDIKKIEKYILSTPGVDRYGIFAVSSIKLARETVEYFLGRDMAYTTDDDAEAWIEVANEFHKLYEAGMTRDSEDKTMGTK